MKNGRIGRKITAGLIAASMLVGLTGCTTFDSFRHTFFGGKESEKNNVIYIGIYEPQTGELAAKGKEEIKGIELANSIYKTVNGYTVELVTVDCKSTSSAAENAISSLIEMKPVVIIGSAGEASSLIASDYINEAKIPTITPSATNPLITQNSGYYFRASLTESQSGAGLAEYAYDELGSRKIGIISTKNDSVIAAFIDGFDEQIEKIENSKKDPVVYRGEVDISDSDYTAVLKAAKKKNVDTLFVSLGAASMDSFFAKAEELGMTDVKYLGTTVWGSPEMAKVLQNHPKIKIAFPYEAVLSADNKTSNAVTAETQRFQIEYANKYGADDIPTENAALGYDAYLLAINAIYRANSTDGNDIRKALHDIEDIQGATGEFRFDNSGNTIRPINISTYEDGNIVSVYITKITAKAEKIEEIEQ